MDISENSKPLWTKNFTIITLGSIVSMLGNALVSFALGLLVLDYSGSSFLYAVYLIVYNMPNVIIPTIAGTFIDRFSRRKMIYTLDFISAGVYGILALALYKGLFNYPLLLISCALLGTIQGIYSVAYDSFYPMLIEEGNYSKAYSIASTLQTMAMIITPVSAALYNLFGIVPIFIFDMITFLIAAILETRIEVEEKYIKRDGVKFSFREYMNTYKEGVEYLKQEKGLRAVTEYFSVTMFASAAMQVLMLPYFKANFNHGEYIFIMVTGCRIIGRTIGGIVHYKFRYPVNKKFAIAITVYTTLAFIDLSILYLPIPVMMLLCFIEGLMGITSYNIRLCATQSHVEDSKKGRFNGAFQMFTTSGMLMGQFFAGILSEVMDVKLVVIIYMIINLIGIFGIVYKNKRYIKPLYNIEA